MRVNILGVYTRRGQRERNWNRIELTEYGQGIVLSYNDPIILKEKDRKPDVSIVTWYDRDHYMLRIQQDRTIQFQAFRGLRISNADLWGPMKEGYEIKGFGLSSKGVCVLWDTLQYDKVSILWGDGEEVRLIHWGQILRC